MRCPACNLEQADGIRFCEDCGGPMGTSVPAVASNSTAVSAPVCDKCGTPREAGDDDFCPRCGAERSSAIEDHFEISINPRLGGVSDRGRVRRRNEDFVALSSSDGVDVLVVCDGVSKSQQADRAARVAASTVCDRLAAATGTDWVAEMRTAIRAADIKVRSLPSLDSFPGDPAETTVVAAVRVGDRVTVGWLGDSRGYWVSRDQLRQLTHDHSWMNEVVDSGEMAREQAATHANAHSITRTLGGPAGEGTGDEPSFAVYEIGTDLSVPGVLLLCTDGFWDFHDDDEQFAEAVVRACRDRPAGTDAVSIARGLVEQACGHRGHDNTTVALGFFETTGGSS